MFFVTLETVNVAHLVHALLCVNTTNVAKHTEESGDLKSGSSKGNMSVQKTCISVWNPRLAWLFETKMHSFFVAA